MIKEEEHPTSSQISEEAWNFEENESEETSSLNSSQKKARQDLKNISKIFTVDIIDFTQAKILLISKFVMLQTKFDYCDFPFSTFYRSLTLNSFILERAKMHLEDRLDSLLGTPENTKVPLPTSQDLKVDTCLICWSETQAKHMVHFGCGHLVERDCMALYIEEKIFSEGPLCVSATCPSASCSFSLPYPLVDSLCSPKASLLYFKHLVSNFCSRAPYIMECLGKDCSLFFSMPEHALSEGLKFPQKNFTCHCGNTMCLCCRKEGHEPLPCSLYQQWEASKEQKIDRLNSAWLGANTKKCPGCKVDIQKNEGCMHMTCKHCMHQFCWLCLGDWKIHGTNSGGFYKCNMYKEEEESSDRKEEERELLRLQFFMDRYLEHKKSLAISQEKFTKLIKLLESKKPTPLTELQESFPDAFGFYIDTMKSIINFRSFITFTYPFAFNIRHQEEIMLFYENQYMMEYALEVLDKEVQGNPVSSFVRIAEDGKAHHSYYYWDKRKSIENLRNSLETQHANACKDFSKKEYIDKVAEGKNPDEMELPAIFTQSKKMPSPTKKMGHSWVCSQCQVFNENNRTGLCCVCNRLGRPKGV